MGLGKKGARFSLGIVAIYAFALAVAAGLLLHSLEPNLLLSPQIRYIHLDLTKVYITVTGGEIPAGTLMTPIRANPGKEDEGFWVGTSWRDFSNTDMERPVFTTAGIYMTSPGSIAGSKIIRSGAVGGALEGAAMLLPNGDLYYGIAGPKGGEVKIDLSRPSANVRTNRYDYKFRVIYVKASRAQVEISNIQGEFYPSVDIPSTNLGEVVSKLNGWDAYNRKKDMYNKDGQNIIDGVPGGIPYYGTITANGLSVPRHKKSATELVRIPQTSSSGTWTIYLKADSFNGYYVYKKEFTADAVLTA